MTLEVAGERTSLAPDNTTVFSIPDADTANFSSLASVELSPAELGAQMQEAIDTTTRASLQQQRRDRACEAANAFLVTPLFPDIDC